MYQNTSNGYQTYQNNQINTSTKEGLLLMLYDGAIKFLRLSIIGIENKEFEKTNKNLIKAQDIIIELMATLNLDIGEISQNLYDLYEFMYNELIIANIEKDIEKVSMVRDMMTELRNSWAEIS